MALSLSARFKLLEASAEIAKAAASSGAAGCCSADVLTDIIESTYKKLLALGEQD